jgi:hypothetical protein
MVLWENLQALVLPTVLMSGLPCEQNLRRHLHLQEPESQAFLLPVFWFSLLSPLHLKTSEEGKRD